MVGVPVEVKVVGIGGLVELTWVPQLSGAPVKAPDIRAGAALVVAALRAEGETLVQDVHHIDRGYEDFVGKLRAIGADVERVAL